MCLVLVCAKASFCQIQLHLFKYIIYIINEFLKGVEIIVCNKKLKLIKNTLGVKKVQGQ